MKPWLIVATIAVVIVAIVVVLKTDIANPLVFRVLFSNKRYAKNIEVKTYVLTQDQVADLFKYPDKEPEQLQVKVFYKVEIVQKPRYFVVRVKNLGNRHAWGTLSCKVRCIHKPFKIPIISIGAQFCNYIICIEGVAISEAKNSPYPDMSYKWSELYTK